MILHQANTQVAYQAEHNIPGLVKQAIKGANNMSSAINSLASRPIYDRKYPTLKRYSWVWRVLATYATFMTWLWSTPWLLLRAIAPEGFQDNLQEVEHSYLNVATPIITFVQDTTYHAFSLFDGITDWVINTAQSVYHQNLVGFEHTFDNVLRNIEHRVRHLKEDGLNGIPKALSVDIHETPLGKIVDKLS